MEDRRKFIRLGRLANKNVEKNVWLTYEKTWKGDTFKMIKMERRDLSGVHFMRSLDFMSQDIVVSFPNLTWDRHNLVPLWKTSDFQVAIQNGVRVSWIKVQKLVFCRFLTWFLWLLRGWSFPLEIHNSQPTEGWWCMLR